MELLCFGGRMPRFSGFEGVNIWGRISLLYTCFITFAPMACFVALKNRQHEGIGRFCCAQVKLHRIGNAVYYEAWKRQLLDSARFPMAFRCLNSGNGVTPL